MPKVVLTAYKCDLCGRESKPDANPKPTGWITYDQEHPMEERAWINRCICPACVTEITNAVKRAGNS